MIKVSQLNYSYNRQKELVLKGLDFEVKPGEIFGFLGPSGAGKSTTQKVLIGLLKGYQGQVSLMGKDLSAWGSDLYENIGVSFEFPNHFLKLTAYENLLYFSRLYKTRTLTPIEVLEQVGLAEDARQPVETFSKGMRNRLTVARALLHNPQLLFLDEPTSGLDPLNARMIKDVIRCQKEQGRTVFLTTHNMTVAEELCDRIALIVDGEISVIDSPQSLKLQYGQPNVCVEAGQNGNFIKQEFPVAGLGRNEVFLELIRSRDVRTIHSLEATLEDVFIQVTGRSLL